MPKLTCTWAQILVARDGDGSEIYYKDGTSITDFCCAQNGMVYKLSVSVPKATFLAHWPKAKPVLDISI